MPSHNSLRPVFLPSMSMSQESITAAVKRQLCGESVPWLSKIKRAKKRSCSSNMWGRGHLDYSQLCNERVYAGGQTKYMHGDSWLGLWWAHPYLPESRCCQAMGQGNRGFERQVSGSRQRRRSFSAEHVVAVLVMMGLFSFETASWHGRQ